MSRPIAYPLIFLLGAACAETPGAELPPADAGSVVDTGARDTGSDAGALDDRGLDPDGGELDAAELDGALVDGGRDGGGRDGGGRDGGRDGGGRDGAPLDGTGLVPIDELGTNTYQGFEGGLYPGGLNTMPQGHAMEGLVRANAVTGLDGAGAPAIGGKYVLLSIGMSNATQEFCSQNSLLPCDAWTFMGKAAVEPGLNAANLVIANGARGGQVAASWTSSASAEYDRIRDNVLTPGALTEAQVVIAWVKLANAQPTTSLPDPNADAFRLVQQAGDVVRALKQRYPNLLLVFLSSRIYAGYASTPLNPEPYAYEQGFAIKWLIEAQINQASGGPVDARAGDLDYGSVAPWIAWAPYLWADGPTPRASDGLVWLPRDFQNDGTHPSMSGENKVSTLLLDFFETSPQTKCWFMTGQTCP